MKATIVTLDGNEATAYRVNDMIAICPITPSSPMGEWAGQWVSEGLPNIRGSVPTVVEMQSECGAVGVLQTGCWPQPSPPRRASC